ncbi:MAG: heme exporter protein CcmD [Candidatus Berkiella sp.]
MLEYLSMNGYGAYIWSSYAISFCLLGGLWMQSARHLSQVKRRLLKKNLSHVA